MKVFDWIKKQLAWILFAVFLFCMIVCFVSGCNYHKRRHPCPEPTIVTHTVILRDTVTHYIDKWHYSQRTDTIIYTDTIIQPVDTLQILADYFALHVYYRNWTDSLLTVDLRDTVTQNRFLQNEFKYRILRPQVINYTTVDNSVNYSSYLYLGMGTMIQDLTMADISVYFANKQLLAGVGYVPSQKYYRTSVAFKIAKFKK
jgi:hypothetical protein